jgi:hypothetical protein
MGMLSFLLIVAAIVVVIIWAMSKSKAESKLAGNLPKRREARPELLSTPTHSVLSQKEELWATRRQQATKNASSQKPFVPGSEARRQAHYDGYSRRDRHHLAPQARLKHG